MLSVSKNSGKIKVNTHIVISLNLAETKTKLKASTAFTCVVKLSFFKWPQKTSAWRFKMEIVELKYISTVQM